MTALSEYERLESGGLWRAGPEAQRREVLVSFGDASLVIADPRTEMAIAHWSLPAVDRRNPGAEPAVYSPDPEGGETLEIDDTTMIEAIEKVRAAIARRRPQPGRLRLATLGLVVATLVALAVFWLPGALVNHATRVVPEAKRAQIGRALLADITALAGPPCRTPLGRAALVRIETRLLPGRGRLLVLDGGVRGSAHLPGGIVLLSAALVEDHEGPEVAAAHVVLERLRAETRDPLARLLDHAGALATFRLLTTGTIPAAALESYAGDLLVAPPVAVPETAFLAALDAAGLPSTPYAYARDATGETTLSLIEADPYRGRTPPRLLSDGAWVSLQGICGE
ncbi:hypothetical protein ACQ5SP_02960 [Rhodovulum sp. YNF3179]|uniref:hypothetical protein n=1 Tax=Rhodovulum sp. YNF3179 TaxID=3425127 RepID=UPI003D330AD7